MAHRTTLNVSLTPELIRFIDSQIASGLYTSGSEIVREALRLFKTYEEVKAGTLAELKAKIDTGVSQARAGKVRDGEQVFSDLERGL